MKNVHMSVVGGSGGTPVVVTVRRKRDPREAEEKVSAHHIVIANLTPKSYHRSVGIHVIYVVLFFICTAGSADSVITS